VKSLRPSQLAERQDCTRGSVEPAGRVGSTVDGEGTVDTKRRWLKVDEYAKAANTTPQTVRDGLRTGRLKGRRFKGRWRVLASELKKRNATR
jgi:hypothetical protein